MNDCVNAAIRDQLPELLHDRLDDGARAAVMAHVDACVDCRAELELLRSTRAMLVAGAPRIDLQFVVQALPKPSAARPGAAAGLTSRRRVWADWRVAAAVTLLVAGGTSVAVLNRGASPAAIDTTTIVASSVAPSVAPSVAATEPAVAATASPAAAAPAESRSTPRSAAEVAASDVPSTTTAPDVGARIGDLNEQQLQKLLKDIDKLQPVPVTEPDPVSLRVTNSSSEGE